MKKLLFGTSGIPLSTVNSNTINGIARVHELGLEAMELEFVHSVNIKKEKTSEVRETAKKNDIVLTCHGQYYINLNSKEKEKQDASIERIFNAASIADMCGAYSMTFHAAFYQGMSSEESYETVKKNLKLAVKKIQDDGHKIWVRPETTGKGSQFGTITEILKLSQEIDQVMPCVDFSHLHARSNGKFNTRKEFQEVLEQIEKSLGRNGLENMHIHLSGIAYNEKGERNHLKLEESDMNYKDLLKVWKEFKIAGVVICESPNIEEDALLLKKTFSKL